MVFVSQDGRAAAPSAKTLKWQVVRVTTWAATRDLAVDRVVTEVGLALSWQRRKFLGLIGDPQVTSIVVEHPDRFACFGAESVRAVLSVLGRRLLVVDYSEEDGDLICDQAEILRSLCVGLYGRRAGASRAARGVAALVADTL